MWNPRQGATLLELAMAFAIAGVLLGVTIPRVTGQLDRLAVDGAARDVRTMLSAARARAIGGARPTSVHFNEDDTTVVFRLGRDTVNRRALGQIFGVTLRATRDSTGFSVNGLGFGRANVSIILARRAAAETVFVSREGRVR